MSEPLVEIVRGPLMEAVHRGDIAVVDAGGTLRAQVGDPSGKITYWRSAAKPFQSMPVVYSGAAARWELGSEDLAILSASHSGQRVHTGRVAALLERIECTADDLVCGSHPPLNAEAAAALARRRVAATALHNNCSGNHAAMLAFARQLGAPIRGYERPEHPVQVDILENVGRFTGLRSEQIAIGVDGCGVPCYGISLYHMAFAFARLMEPQGIPELHAAAARVVADAMIQHPQLVAGIGRFDTDVMAAGRGALLAKGGASGVQCVGIAGGIGLALKLEDGATGPVPGRPVGVAAIEALRQLGALDDAQLSGLRDHAQPGITTLAGTRVGEGRPAFELTFARSGTRRSIAPSIQA